MSEIYLIPNIQHIEGKTRYLNSNNELESLHEYQGSKDGACAIYSFLMALKHTKYITNEDIAVYGKANRRSAKGKLLYELMESRGLVRRGTAFKELTRTVKSICKNIYIEHIPFTTNSTVINKIDVMIKDNWVGATILGIDYKSGGGHAVLLTGVELDTFGKISKILCLDPSCQESHIAPWNCYIDVRNRRGKHPFVCYDNKGSVSDNCKISELIYMEYA